jgi:hypothetical protein
MNHLCWIKNSWANPQFCSPCHLVWNINQLVPRLNIFKTLGSRTLTRNVICIPCSLMSINWLIAWHHRVLILGLGTSNSFKISACCVYRAVERLGGTISTTFPAHLPGSTRSGMQMYSQLVLWHLQGHRHCVEGKTLRVVTCPQNNNYLTKMNIHFLPVSWLNPASFRLKPCFHPWILEKA